MVLHGRPHFKTNIDTVPKPGLHNPIRTSRPHARFASVTGNYSHRRVFSLYRPIRAIECAYYDSAETERANVTERMHRHAHIF